MHCLYLRFAILGLKAMAVGSPDDTLLFAIHTFTREFNPGDGLPVQQRPVELGVLCKPVRSWCIFPQYLPSACLRVPANQHHSGSRMRMIMTGGRLATRYARQALDGLPACSGHRCQGKRSIRRRGRAGGCCRGLRRRSPNANDRGTAGLDV